MCWWCVDCAAKTNLANAMFTTTAQARPERTKVLWQDEDSPSDSKDAPSALGHHKKKVSAAERGKRGCIGNGSHVVWQQREDPEVEWCE